MPSHPYPVRTASLVRRAVVACLVAAVALPALVTSVAAQDQFDPMKYAGCTVRIALVDGERDEKGLQDIETQIEAETGINIEVTTLEINALGEAIDQNLRADQSNFDIVHIIGFNVAGQVGAGLIQEITDWVANPSRTPADYDFADFPAGNLNYAGYFDAENGEFGGDKLYLIPGIHWDSVLLFYRKDVLDAAGTPVPTTWAEYLETAKTLTTDESRAVRWSAPMTSRSCSSTGTAASSPWAAS